MRREIFESVEIPEGVEATIEGNMLKVKGPNGENHRNFALNGIEMKKEDGKIIVGSKAATKNEKRMINTTAAHIKNMVNGVNEGYEYTLKVASSHFPITVEIKGKEAIVKNFLGERVPRRVKLLDGADVKLNGDIITVTSYDKELAGQTAANFEKATKIRLRDRRIFQDGIFITKKAGREI